MKNLVRDALMRHRLDGFIVVVACALLVSGFFVRKAEVSEAPTAAASEMPALSIAAVKSMRVLPGVTAFSIDTVSQADAAPIVIASRPSSVSIRRNTASLFSGWAADVPGHRPANAVFLTVDGKAAAACPIDVSRPDVAKALGDPIYDRSGFHCAMNARTFPAGRHHLGIEIAVGDGKSYYASDFPTVLDAE